MRETNTDILREFINNYPNILIIAGSSKKMDTLPAAYALGLVLENDQKTFRISFSGRVPDRLAFLNLDHYITTPSQKQNECSVVIDTGTLPVQKIRSEKNGSVLKIIITAPPGAVLESDKIKVEGGGFRKKTQKITWDAAITLGVTRAEHDALRKEYPAIPFLNIRALQRSHENPSSKDRYMLDKEASSVSETLARELKNINEQWITPKVATALLAGIIAATQNFQDPSIHPQTLFTAAYLISKNAENEKIVRYLYKTKPLELMRLWGSVIAKFHYDPVYKIGWSVVEGRDMHKTGARPSHVTRLVNELKNNFAEAEIFIIGVERAPGRYVAIVHGKNIHAVKKIAHKWGVSVKNATMLIPLSSRENLASATQKITKKIQDIL